MYDDSITLESTLIFRAYRDYVTDQSNLAGKFIKNSKNYGMRIENR